MARRMVEVVECDVCESSQDVVHYSITAPHGTSQIDLCSTHRRAVDEVFESGRIRRRPGRRPQVDKTAQKSNGAGTQKAAKKAAAKKTSGRSSSKKTTKSSRAAKR